MISDEMLPDRLKLIKTIGTVLEDIKANVQSKIYIGDVTTPVVDGDTIEYQLPTGQVKRLIVTDVRAPRDINGEPNHLSVQYEKL